MSDCIQKLDRIFGERVRALLEDGYLCIFISDVPNGHFVKLRHKRTGRIVTLRADFGEHTIRQYADNKLVHEETVHQS